MQVYKNEKLDETFYEIDHKSGLKILLSPKPGFSSSYALFGTNYGSIDNSFKDLETNEIINLPEGVAHFLEHKLFEGEHEDAFSKYAKTGASANAFTSFSRTAYLFSTSENFDESLEILLSFVTSPHFTDEKVEKEQGIIGQEIRMYDDMASWRVFFNMLQGLYVNHPARIDIAGSVESISRITADILYKCYETFYNLNNMVLCIAGDFDTDRVIRIADSILKPSKDIRIERILPEEPEEVAGDYIEQKLSVATELFYLGFKERPESGIEKVRGELLSQIILEIIAGTASPLYKRLLDKDLINNTFEKEFMSDRSFAINMFGGETSDPKKVREEILSEIEAYKRNGIDAKDFERTRKAIYGNAISSFNSLQYIANSMLKGYFSDYNLYDTIDIIPQLNLEDINKRLQEQFDFNKNTLSVIKPY